MLLKIAQKIYTFEAKAYTKLNIHITINRVMALLSLLNKRRIFGGIYRLHLQVPKTTVHST